MHLWDGALLGDVCAAGMRVRAAPAVFGYDAVAYPAAGPETGADVLDRTPALAAEFAGESLVRRPPGQVRHYFRPATAPSGSAIHSRALPRCRCRRHPAPG